MNKITNLKEWKELQKKLQMTPEQIADEKEVNKIKTIVEMCMEGTQRLVDKRTTGFDKEINELKKRIMKLEEDKDEA